MKVWVAVHGRFHAFELAGELHRRGLLAGLATTYPAFVARRFLPPGVPLRTLAWAEFVRRVAGRAAFLPEPDVAIARAFGRFAARALGPADLLVGWSGASLEAIAAARAQGMRVVIERGSTHIRHQARELAQEYDRFGIPRRPVDDRMLAREVAEYAAADAIALPSTYAAQTFVNEGVPADRLIVNPYGADLTRFAPHAAPARRSMVRLLFVGRVGLRKGIPTLLRAFARVHGPGVELHLVGPVEPGMSAVLASEPMDGVVLRGILRTPDIEQAFRDADIFCLPSIEEGFPLALLQAMASGLPVVATFETGAADIISDGRQGLLVPARDSAALGDALAALVEDAALRQRMAVAARSRVETGFGWADYGDRAVSGYRRLLDRARVENSLASTARRA